MPHVVVGHSEPLYSRIAEGGEDQTGGHIICDLVIIQLELVEFHQVWENHTESLHGLFIHLEVFDANLFVVWVIVVVELCQLNRSCFHFYAEMLKNILK